MQQRQAAQPVEQFIAIRRREYILQRIVTPTARMARSHRQQVQIVITEHTLRCVAEIFYKTQYLQGLRPAIDQIADKPEPVCGRIKRNALQQRKQLIVAALHVTKGVNRHVAPFNAPEL